MYFIRPRQDFSLARIAAAVRTLVLCEFDVRVVEYNKGKTQEILLQVDIDELSVNEKAVAVLCEDQHFVPRNFRIIELSRAEVLAEVDG